MLIVKDSDRGYNPQRSSLSRAGHYWRSTLNTKTITDSTTIGEKDVGGLPAQITTDARAQALANTKAAAVEAEIKALPVERQRDILLDACQAFMVRHGANAAIIEDPAYSSIVHAVRVVQTAKG